MVRVSANPKIINDWWHTTLLCFCGMAVGGFFVDQSFVGIFAITATSKAHENIMDTSGSVAVLERVGEHVGASLSTEHRAALESSLTILRGEGKFAHVSFWGKIEGIRDDYFIAQVYTHI